jgi:predicted site-specific integrase-resolvase
MNQTLSSTDTCEYLQVCRRTLKRYEDAGLLAPVKLNKRKFLFLKEDIDAMLEKFKSGRAA